MRQSSTATGTAVCCLYSMLYGYAYAMGGTVRYGRAPRALYKCTCVCWGGGGRSGKQHEHHRHRTRGAANESLPRITSDLAPRQKNSVSDLVVGGRLISHHSTSQAAAILAAMAHERIMPISTTSRDPAAFGCGVGSFDCSGHDHGGRDRCVRLSRLQICCGRSMKKNAAVAVPSIRDIECVPVTCLH